MASFVILVLFSLTLQSHAVRVGARSEGQGPGIGGIVAGARRNRHKSRNGPDGDAVKRFFTKSKQGAVHWLTFLGVSSPEELSNGKTYYPVNVRFTPPLTWAGTSTDYYGRKVEKAGECNQGTIMMRYSDFEGFEHNGWISKYKPEDMQIPETHGFAGRVSDFFNFDKAAVEEARDGREEERRAYFEDFLKNMFRKVSNNGDLTVDLDQVSRGGRIWHIESAFYTENHIHAEIVDHVKNLYQCIP